VKKLKAECVWYVYERIFCIAGGDHIECSDRYHVYGGLHDWTAKL
jgi:hypothetical protein